MSTDGSIGEGEFNVVGVSDAGERGKDDVRMQQSQQRVVVYVTPSCPQCMLTKHVLDAKGVDYQVVDVTMNENALAYVQDDLGNASPTSVRRSRTRCGCAGTSTGWDIER